MKIVVIGGSGLIGSRVVTQLRQRGHEVLAASPSTGVNTVTGEGLKEAFAGADVVIDVANSPSFEAAAALAFFEAAGRNIFAAEKAAGVKLHVALSVVGTERLLEFGYFGAKLARAPDRKFRAALHHRPRHAVFRIRRRHRAGSDAGTDRPRVVRADPADGGR